MILTHPCKYSLVLCILSKSLINSGQSIKDQELQGFTRMKRQEFFFADSPLISTFQDSKQDRIDCVASCGYVNISHSSSCELFLAFFQ